MEEQQGQSKQPRTRREFTTEFKRDAVALVRATGRPIAQIPASLASTTPRWATGCARTPSIGASARVDDRRARAAAAAGGRERQAADGA
jgi:hypothetical protein